MNRKMVYILTMLMFSCVSLVFGSVTNHITIDGDTPWVVMEKDFENPAIQKAIRDAERDWYKVFGYPPVIFKNDTRRNWDGPVVIFGSVQNTKNLLNVFVPEGAEQHALLLAQVKHNPAIAAVGADTRGTIYAIYTFCEEVLGIDPMYVFTDHVPQKRKEITFTVEDEYTSKKPTFENRGWFINDEELHDGMHRDPLGGNVISMEWMDKIIETLLRCKGNMIAPESAPYSDATVYELCKRRDVIITFHHILPAGLNMMDWPKGVPFSFINHKDILIDAWTKAAQANADKKVAWIVGFRGESDGAFWHSDPAAPEDDIGRAAVIAEAMQAQTDIIRGLDRDATIVAALWNELGRFYNAGILEVPEGVCKMFADDGRGFMRDKGDGTDLDAGDGLYYHVMMMMNTQNRTTEGVPPSRIYKELRRYVERGATKYAIINVSGIRPAAMSTQAMMDFLWDAKPFLSSPPDEAMREYLLDWYGKSFGATHAEVLTNLRLHYYDIPYMRELMPDPHRWRGARGEHLIQYQIQELLKHYGKAIQAGEDISKIDQFGERFKQATGPLVDTEDFFPRLWAKTKVIEKQIPEDRKDYYQAHFTYQVAVHMYSCRALAIMTDAVRHYLDDCDPEAFATNIAPALEEIEKIIAEAHKAEYGIWNTMFMHVRLMDIWRTRLLLKQTIAKIEGKPYTSGYRGFMNGSFWGSAQAYMDTAEGVYPYFYKHSGRGLDILEKDDEPKVLEKKGLVQTMERSFNVKEFGAIGDGFAMDTQAFQDAVDNCEKSGGGIVLVPAGRYLVGTIKLKSHVDLRLEDGAELLGSLSLDDYAYDIQGAIEAPAFDECLIYAENSENIKITGKGIINGQGTQENFPIMLEDCSLGDRPMLIRFVDCKDITLDNVTLKNAASWCTHLVSSDDIVIRNVTIDSHVNRNNDGLDLDGCKNVLIENCNIRTGDDSICPKSTTTRICENITVKNCRLESNTSAFKCGTSSRGGFKNITVSDCDFSGTRMGAIKLLAVDGGILENIAISNIVMNNVEGPIFIRLANRGRTYHKPTEQIQGKNVAPEGAPVGSIKNIRISNISATVTGTDKSRTGPIMISGIPGHCIENVLFENVTISYPGGGTAEDAVRVISEDEARYPEQFFFGVLPSWGAYIRHARNIVFRNVVMKTRSPDERKIIVLDDVEEFINDMPDEEENI